MLGIYSNNGPSTLIDPRVRAETPYTSSTKAALKYFGDSYFFNKDDISQLSSKISTSIYRI